MRRTFLTALVAATLGVIVSLGAVRSAQATEVGYSRRLGLGVVFGEPFGLSAKYWVGPTNSLDFGLGFWGYGFDRCYNDGPCTGYGYNGGSFNMDYLWQSNLVRGQVQLDWHIGAGGRLIWFDGCGPNNSCLWLGARMPIGLDLMFTNPSFLEVFVELAPALYFLPPLRPGIEPGIGVRAYF